MTTAVTTWRSTSSDVSKAGGNSPTTPNNRKLIATLSLSTAETIAPSLIIIVCVGLSVAIVVLVIIFMCIFMRRGKRKLPPADLIANHHHKMSEKGGNGGGGGGNGGGQCKDSDRSSNISDLKAEIRSSAYDHDYSEAGSDSIANRLAANMLGNSHHNINQGVPLAGPVQIPSDYRYVLLNVVHRPSCICCL